MATGPRKSPVAPTIIWTPFLNRSMQILRMLGWEGSSIDNYIYIYISAGERWPPGSFDGVQILPARMKLKKLKQHTAQIMSVSSPWLFDNQYSSREHRTWGVIGSHALAVEPIWDWWHLITHSTSLRWDIGVWKASWDLKVPDTWLVAFDCQVFKRTISQPCDELK